MGTIQHSKQRAWLSTELIGTSMPVWVCSATYLSVVPHTAYAGVPHDANLQHRGDLSVKKPMLEKSGVVHLVTACTA